ncbi:Txe/YoeB family addiction module toxin [Crocosphaera chwakensis]|uniref:Txe/YoeB family addiction module toxin n=1 Tax=Crocosphaera chwakensis TaxID=2546361 RepID=UPI0009039CC5|nr:Txe/YoeB family addiction module toxin [Crocosphaera chwakensis]
MEFSGKALNNVKKIQATNLQNNVKQLIEILKDNPYTPPYEKLSGNLKGYYSRRINIKHRLVYSINDETKIIQVVSV